MQKNHLKKLITSDGLRELLCLMSANFSSPVSVLSADGDCLIADLRLIEAALPLDTTTPHQFPVTLNEDLVGFVRGPAQAEVIARCIAFAVRRETERRLLAAETLDKYREISVLYRFAERIAACLDAKEIAQLVLTEATGLIAATSASVMLFNEKTMMLEVLAGTGQFSESRLALRPNEGIAGYVFTAGRPEIINDVVADSRYVPHGTGGRPTRSYSLICAPLTVKEKSIGIINISNLHQATYSAKDLKILSVLTAQAASAIENALLHKNRLEQMRIRNNLGRYLSPQVVESVISTEGEISLSTSKRKVTMLFSDIRSFTARCEELEAETIVSHLNEYFSALVSVIFSHGGTVNKFVGDMIVAMFGAPSNMEHQELSAIQSAIGMQKCLKAFPNSWIRNNFLTGIGISSGESVVGNIGSDQHMDYTVIGDEVNIASRLQDLAAGGKILVTRSVHDAVQDYCGDGFLFLKFGTLEVKGKRKLVEIYEVVYD